MLHQESFQIEGFGVTIAVSLSWTLEKYGIVAFSVCLVELVGIWIPFALVSPYTSAPWLVRMWAVLYLAGLLSIPVAIIGLFIDKRRLLALLALIFGIVNIVLCVGPLI